MLPGRWCGRRSDSPPYLQRSIRSEGNHALSLSLSAITVAISDPDACGVQTEADAIDFVTLIRCGSVTHHFDADQRCIRLDITGRPSSNKITVASLPPQVPGQPLGGAYIAPPGYYFLFAVTKPDPQTQRRVQVPSVATFVHITP